MWKATRLGVYVVVIVIVLFGLVCMTSVCVCSFQLSLSGQNFSRFLFLPSSPSPFIHHTSEIQEIIQLTSILEAFHYKEPPFIIGLDMIHDQAPFVTLDRKDIDYPNAYCFYLSD